MRLSDEQTGCNARIQKFTPRPISYLVQNDCCNCAGASSTLVGVLTPAYYPVTGWAEKQHSTRPVQQTTHFFTSGLAAIGAGHIIPSNFRWFVVKKKLCCKTSQKLGFKMAGSNHELPHISLQLLGARKKNDEETGLGRNLESGWSVQGWGSTKGATSRFLVGGFQVWESLGTPAKPLKPEKGAGSF